MVEWKTRLFSNNAFLGNDNTKRGILKGVSFTSLLFLIALMPKAFLLWKEKMGSQAGKACPFINHLKFMADLKLIGKSENQIDSLVKMDQICSSDISKILIFPNIHFSTRNERR